MRGERPRIDLALAQAQHAAYVEAMRGIGFAVRVLPPLDEHPDACFVEDVALWLSEVTVLLRPGAPARRPETDAIRPDLQADPIPILPPARIDGGDLLVLGRTIFVGLSTRTDDAGVAALRDAVASHGWEVRPLPVRRGLHLLSAVCGHGDVVLAEPGAVDADAMGRRVVFVEGPVNFVGNGDAVLVPSSSDRAAEALAREGLRVVRTDISELEKGDAGATCLSLRECTGV